MHFKIMFVLTNNEVIQLLNGQTKLINPQVLVHISIASLAQHPNTKCAKPTIKDYENDHLWTGRHAWFSSYGH